MKKKTVLSKVLSLLLVFVPVFGSVPLAQIPVYASEGTAQGNEEVPTDMGEIIAFEELAPEIAVQNVPLGTEESGLDLPDALRAKVRMPLDVTSAVYDSADTTDISIPVRWTSTPTYDGDTAGEYIFAAAVEGYSVSTEPPVISVTVGDVTEGVITAFAELPEDIRWQNTMTPEFPETVEGKVEGKTVEIPVSWEADHEYNAESPERGLYVFTAVLGEGYGVVKGVELPRITVFIPRTAGLMMMRMTGSGTTASPLEITTAAQLAEIATLVNARENGLEKFLFNDESATVHLKLIKDIDLSEYSKGEGWTPIGAYISWTDRRPFKGHFDGNGKVITGLYINRDADNQGLFGFVVGGTIENVGVTDANITGEYNVGPVAGYVNSGTVQNSYGSGNVTGDSNVGGVTGFVDGVMQNCYSTASVSGWSEVGGVVGYVSGSGSKGQNCYSTGSVSGKFRVGGVAGMVFCGKVQNCYSTGGISGSRDHVGGVVGYLYGATVENCYSSGSVTGDSYVGGVAGYLTSYNDLSEGVLHYSTVQNCAALNSSVSGTSDVGRVIGLDDGGTFSNNCAFAGMTVTVDSTDKSIVNDANGVDGEAKTADNIKGAGFFETMFNNDSAWEYSVGKLPVLKGLAGQNDTLPFHISGSFFAGSGTSASDPYLIKTAADLAKLAELVNAGTSTYADAGKYFRLENNIDLSAYSNGEGWTPIGDYISWDDIRPFKGHFDGNGKVITGLYINRSDADDQGLFGYVLGGTIENVGVTNVNITGREDVGAVAAYVDTGTVRNCFSNGNVTGDMQVGGVTGFTGGLMQNCYSTATVSGWSRVGGVVGVVYWNTLQNCYSSGNVTGDQWFVGGVAGYVFEGTVKNCYSTGTVSCTGDYVGGVAGYVGDGRGVVENCYATGVVTGENYVGGVAGCVKKDTELSVVYYSTVQNCAALNSSVSGTSDVGRVAGNNQGTLSNNYAFSAIPGSWNNKGLSAVDGADVSSQDLYDKHFWTTAANWNGGSWDESVWTIENEELPVLKGFEGQNGDGGLKLLVREIQYAKVTLDRTSFTYNGKEQRPNLTVTFDDETLMEDRDYTVAITSMDGEGTSAGTKVGTVTLTITGKGNFSGTQKINYTIERRSGGGGSGGSGSGGSTSPVTQINNGSSTPSSNLQQLVSEGQTLTVVDSNGAKVVFDTEALQGISSQASGDIKVEIKDVSAEHQESLPGKIVFSLTISSGRGTISNIGGRITVSLPYELKEGEPPQDVTVWHLAEDGTMTKIPCTYDPVTKLVTFTVTHFSLYVVGVSDPWVNPFKDVVESDWFYGAVEFVNRNGLFAGTGTDTFSPNSPMTRAMLWTVLGRLDGQSLSGSSVFDAARTWAMGAGITDGTNPDGSITREQMVTVMWRYAGSPKAGGDLSVFSDVDSVEDYAAEAMAWVVEKGIITGANGALMPQDNATRAQVAAVLQRCVEKANK